MTRWLITWCVFVVGLVGIAGTSYSCGSNLTTCTDEKLCIWATSESRLTNNTVWTKSLNHQNYIVEAKRRGLSCGVTNMVTSSTENCSVVDKKLIPLNALVAVQDHYLMRFQKLTAVMFSTSCEKKDITIPA